MAEQWQSTPRSRHLSGRRNEGTLPEMRLRSALHRLGARFRLHRRLAPGCSPDIVLPRHKVAVFVDGCFWHNCPKHGRKRPWSGPNARLWEAKLARTAKRDTAAVEVAEALGWKAVRIWECDVMADPEAVARKLL
ncbi:very short patch repair endonuclease [Mycobacterium sp. 1165178.9]|uniref:very short patch repair endonuclease n=1 Tax=Mycobacterium sp. 1165178.9 TaxID=1834070 RepID=UPI0009F6AF7D|nr:very short patch repair endonuclease [Mycobacterium sp. 1165178.9]